MGFWGDLVDQAGDLDRGDGSDGFLIGIVRR
jgi:hypothetical protein